MSHHGDGTKVRQQVLGSFQQGDHHLRADAGTGMLERPPQQRDRPAMSDLRKHHYSEAVPQHRGVEFQMQGVAWLLPDLNRPEHQWAVESFHVGAFIAEPAPAAALPAASKAMTKRQSPLPMAKTHGLAEQQASHHPVQMRQVPLVTSVALLTEQARQLSMELDVGIHEGLD